MRFVFVESFDIKDWNGEIARLSRGISGSHSAGMYLAEGLANMGHTINFVSTNNNMVETVYLGVNYVNIDNFGETTCDYVITTNNLRDLSILHNIHVGNKVIILMHNDLCNHEMFFQFDKNMFIIAYFNDFCKINIENTQPFLKDCYHIILPNSIDLNDIRNFNVHEKENALCYFPCYERGYKMAVEVMNRLNHFKMYTNTYLDKNRHLINANDKVIQTNGFSKTDVFNYLVRSKYFVYPLINLDTNIIHYDTFAYVILEALLHGVIVIAPKIKVYEELYADAICYIDTDNIIEKEDLLYWKKSNPKFGMPLLYRYLEKIDLLENSEELRNQYIAKGLEIGKKYSNTIISIRLMEMIEACETPKLSALQEHLLDLSNKDLLPDKHIQYLNKLKAEGFEPKVIYDIGSCVLHWTVHAKRIWPEAKIILFDAFEPAKFLYKDYENYVGVLSDKDDDVVKFYQNDYFPGGNSYYREIGGEGGFFPEDRFIEKKTRTLDSIVKERGFPLPDFIKIDVQGCEVDILRGGENTVQHARRMVIELQHTEYNLGAKLANESIGIIENMGWICSDPLFQNNGCDGDYGFLRDVR